MYADNVYYARATKAEYIGSNNYQRVNSGQTTPIVKMTARWNSDDVPEEEINTETGPGYGDGYQDRNTQNRVRAVYDKSDTDLTIPVTLE